MRRMWWRAAGGAAAVAGLLALAGCGHLRPDGCGPDGCSDADAPRWREPNLLDPSVHRLADELDHLVESHSVAW